MTLPPTTFKDKEGRTWDLTLDLSIAYRIDSMNTIETYGEDISFLEPSDTFFKKALMSPKFMFQLIWLIVLDQVKDRIKDENNQPVILTWNKDKLVFDDQYYKAELLFVKAFGGKEIKEAKLALQQAFLDFFQEQETVLSNLISQIKEANQKIEAELLKINPTIMQAIDKELERKRTEALKDLENILLGK